MQVSLTGSQHSIWMVATADNRVHDFLTTAQLLTVIQILAFVKPYLHTKLENAYHLSAQKLLMVAKNLWPQDMTLQTAYESTQQNVDNTDIFKSNSVMLTKLIL